MTLWEVLSAQTPWQWALDVVLVVPGPAVLVIGCVELVQQKKARR